MVRMTGRVFRHRTLTCAKSLLFGIVITGYALHTGTAQTAAVEDLGSCTLKNHVYTCNSAAFGQALAAANTIGVETHNSDGGARIQLQIFIKDKLNKSVADDDRRADLIFLLIPTGEAGIIDAQSGDIDLGTLRIYSAAPGGGRGHLLWAETYTGKPDLPWPAVVRGLILKFQKDFPAK